MENLKSSYIIYSKIEFITFDQNAYLLILEFLVI